MKGFFQGSFKGSLNGDPLRDPTWEFPQLGDPNIVPYIVESLVQGPQNKVPLILAKLQYRGLRIEGSGFKGFRDVSSAGLPALNPKPGTPNPTSAASSFLTLPWKYLIVNSVALGACSLRVCPSMMTCASYGPCFQ